MSSSKYLDKIAIALSAVKLPSLNDFRRVKNTILRSSGIGIFVGVLPAEGSTMAAMIGYNEAKRGSNRPEEFGKGVIEGVAGPEAANNAATGAAMIPLLALGIHGGALSAMMVAVFQMNDLEPCAFVFYYFIEILLFAIYTNNALYTILYSLSLVPSGNFVLSYIYQIRKYRQHLRLLTVFYQKRNIVYQIIEERQKLIKYINEAKDEYMRIEKINSKE